MSIQKLPEVDRETPLNQLLLKRASVREFEPRSLQPLQISHLLWACQGVNSYRRRTAPSAGALYPLEVYWLDRDHLAHYAPSTHTLETLQAGDLRKSLAEAALSQDFIAQAPATVVICAVYERVTRKYGHTRGVRYVHMEVGHAAQNLILQACAIGLGCVPVGAFSDEAVAGVMGLPADHEPVYLLPVGYA